MVTFQAGIVEAFTSALSHDVKGPLAEVSGTLALPVQPPAALSPAL